MVSLGVGSGAASYASEKAWGETLNNHPLGDKYKKEVEAAKALREEYSSQNSNYERRLQITKEFQEKEQIIDEMYKDIASSVQMPQSIFDYGKNKGAYLSMIFTSVGLLGAHSTFMWRRRGENQPTPNPPRYTP